MTFAEEIGLGGLAALGTIGTVCAVLLRSTHQNLITLDIMRREALVAAEKLRQELRDNDDTIFELQSLCADYRYAIAKLEAELSAARGELGRISQAKRTRESQSKNSLPARPNPEDILD